MTATPPFFAMPEEGRALWHMGALMNFKVVGEDTGGQFWLAEQTSAQGYASPLHQHSREDELFIVLSGEISVTVGDKQSKVPEGALAYAPRNLPHTFQVLSDEARFLILTTPAGFENWFFETGEPARTATIPAPPTGPPDIGRLIGSLQAYGVQFLAPPPGMGPPPGME